MLERLAGCTTLLVDKTGTLTIGRPVVAAVVTNGSVLANDVLSLAASVDQVSPHVLAETIIREARSRGRSLTLPEEVEEVPGEGVRGEVGGHRVAVGKAAWVGVTGRPAWVTAGAERRSKGP